jgi:hypothetical protein
VKEATLQRTVTLGLLAFIVFLFVGLGSAHCDERRDVARPAALYLSLSAADLGSTQWAIRNGATEGNPWMAEHGAAKQLAVSAALTAADIHLQKRGHHRKLRVLVTVLRVAAVGINIHNARRKQ